MDSVWLIDFITVLVTVFQLLSSCERPNCFSVGYKSKSVGVIPSAHIMLNLKSKLIDSIGLSLNAFGENTM